jgi:demethylmenaquinone methyltransferase/2-methoxy-6-polyprenyl-1,4-benzoquinol methylase
LAWPNQRELGIKISAAGYESVAYRNLTFGIVAVHRGLKPKAKLAATAKPAAKAAAKARAKKVSE